MRARLLVPASRAAAATFGGGRRRRAYYARQAIIEMTPRPFFRSRARFSRCDVLVAIVVLASRGPSNAPSNRSAAGHSTLLT